MGGRGGPGNYYAITHKPIDLDWTPGGRAARSWARPDLLQDQARKLKCTRYIHIFDDSSRNIKDLSSKCCDIFYLLMFTLINVVYKKKFMHILQFSFFHIFYIIIIFIL